MAESLLSLYWNYHSETFAQAVGNLKESEKYSDVTIACGGNVYPTHKFVLSACSEYFSKIIDSTPSPHPVIVLIDADCKHVEAILTFIYTGAVTVTRSDLQRVIKVAEILQIRGLSVAEEEIIPNGNQSQPSAGDRHDARSSPLSKWHYQDMDAATYGKQLSSLLSSDKSPVKEKCVRTSRINWKSPSTEHTSNTKGNVDEGDTDHIPPAAGIDSDQVLPASGIDSDQVSPASGIDSDQIPPAPRIESDQNSSASGIDSDQVPRAPRIDSDHISPASGIDSDQVSPASGIDSDQVPPASRIDFDQISPASGIDSDQVSQASQIYLDQILHASQTDPDQVPQASQIDSDQAPHASGSDSDQLPQVTKVDCGQVSGASGSGLDQVPYDDEDQSICDQYTQTEVRLKSLVTTMKSEAGAENRDLHEIYDKEHRALLFNALGLIARHQEIPQQSPQKGRRPTRKRKMNWLSYGEEFITLSPTLMPKVPKKKGEIQGTAKPPLKKRGRPRKEISISFPIRKRGRPPKQLCPQLSKDFDKKDTSDTKNLFSHYKDLAIPSSDIVIKKKKRGRPRKLQTSDIVLKTNKKGRPRKLQTLYPRQTRGRPRRQEPYTVNTKNECVTESSDPSMPGPSMSDTKFHKLLFKCGFCSYSTCFQSVLTRHIRRHTGEKPYACDECGMCFTQKAGLQDHEITHTSFHRFKCKMCPFKSKRKAGIRKHMRLH